jgi:hypothetical protein
MQSGAADAIKLSDAVFKDVAALLTIATNWSATVMWFWPFSRRRVY